MRERLGEKDRVGWTERKRERESNGAKERDRLRWLDK